MKANGSLGAQSHAAQHRINRLREMPDIHARRSERKMGKGEVGIEIDRPLHLGQGLLVQTDQRWAPLSASTS